MQILVFQYLMYKIKLLLMEFSAGQKLSNKMLLRRAKLLWWAIKQIWILGRFPPKKLREDFISKMLLIYKYQLKMDFKSKNQRKIQQTISISHNQNWLSKIKDRNHTENCKRKEISYHLRVSKQKNVAQFELIFYDFGDYEQQNRECTNCEQILDKIQDQLFVINILLMKTEEELIKYCIDNNESQKIVSLPIQFAYLAVDILAKQFTKLNSPHEHRIHYLGPRYTSTQVMHKKCAYLETASICSGVPDRKINKYRLDIKRIANSFFINERLRTNHFYKTGLYYRAFQGMNPTLDPKQQFLFNGGFESANLDCVIKIKPREFDLFLRIDSNTRGHLQWFYFSIENGHKLQKIKLNICNISKPGTFYETLMQPYIFSLKAFEKKNENWKQGDERITNVSFAQKPLNYKILADKVSVHPYCYSFQYQFQFENDQVYFAYCIPYTYSQMIADIEKLPQQFVRVYTLGRSLTGLDIPLLHITDSNTPTQEKRNILITGRVHPGESNGSHVLKGFINYLCSSQKTAIQTRKITNFYIIPMLNPDGVILGNSRCSASGRDLNRVFPNSDRELFPEIHILKSFTQKFLASKEIFLYFDFHGHSKKKNTFFYGPSYPLVSPNYLKCRVLPRMIQKINCGFRYHSCNFSISQNKKSTGRATMFELFQIPYTYTVQSSIGYYYDSEQLKTFSFNREAYQKMGESICQGTLIFTAAIEQYENYLKQRRAQRERKRFKFSLNKRNDRKYSFQQEEEGGESVKAPLKIHYKQSEQCTLIKWLQEIKTLPQNQKVQQEIDLDGEASSDDHDQKQDFEVTKLKQFHNLIIQNARKDNLMNKLTQIQTNEMKSFVRSGNLLNQQTKSSRPDCFEQQMELFQRLNIKSAKSKSSHGTRIKYFLDDKPTTKNLRSRVIKKQNQTNEQRKSNNFTKKNHQYTEQRGQSKGQQIQMFYPDKFEIFQKKQHKFRSTTMGKGESRAIWLPQKDRAPHFSEMHFPDEDKVEQKRLMRHQKTDLLRKNIERRRQQEKGKLGSINCSQLAIMKQPNKQFEESEGVHKKFTQFKIDDIMSNLEYRSKCLKDSVKYRDGKYKIKGSLMFPSSFYGVKQQLSSKKRSTSYNIDETLAITVKNLYNDK